MHILLEVLDPPLAVETVRRRGHEFHHLTRELRRRVLRREG